MSYVFKQCRYKGCESCACSILVHQEPYRYGVRKYYNCKKVFGLTVQVEMRGLQVISSTFNQTWYE